MACYHKHFCHFTTTAHEAVKNEKNTRSPTRKKSTTRKKHTRECPSTFPAMHRDSHESGHEAKDNARERALEPFNNTTLHPLLKQPWIITQMLRVSSLANKVDANGSSALRSSVSRLARNIILSSLHFFIYMQHSYSPYLFFLPLNFRM